MMNKMLYIQIVSSIITAQKYSDAAKFNMEERKNYYNMKHNEINYALYLIKHNNIPQIRYKELTAPDQNGVTSRIIYFEIKFFNETLQVSFHDFDRLDKPVKGTKAIEWDGLVGQSRQNCIRLDKRFGLHIFEQEL